MIASIKQIRFPFPSIDPNRIISSDLRKELLFMPFKMDRVRFLNSLTQLYWTCCIYIEFFISTKEDIRSKKCKLSYLWPKVCAVTAGCMEYVPGNVRKIDQTQIAYTAFVKTLVSEVTCMDEDEKEKTNS